MRRMDKIIDRAAEVCGGHGKLAARLGVSPQSVTNWRQRGIPLWYCTAIEIASAGAVRRWQMRPDDWHRIWPELIGSAGAPAINEEPTTQPGALTEDA